MTLIEFRAEVRRMFDEADNNAKRLANSDRYKEGRPIAQDSHTYFLGQRVVLRKVLDMLDEVN